MISSKLWYSPDAVSNVQHLYEEHRGLLEGMADIDRLGHEILEGAIEQYTGGIWETTVGLALLRRAVVQFGGVRYLCEHSSIQSATLVARAHFETLLAARYLIYGSRRFVSGTTPTTARAREIRARYYRTEELRREIYRRQALLDGRFGVHRLRPRLKNALQKEIGDLMLSLDKEFPTQQRNFGRFRFIPDPLKPKLQPKHFDRLTWFSFGFNKKKRNHVTTIRDLAKVFGWLQDYEMLYEAYSGFAHVRGLKHDIEIDPSGLAVRVPHAPDDFATVVHVGCHRQLFMLSCFARAYFCQLQPVVQVVGRSITPHLERLRPRPPLGMT